MKSWLEALDRILRGEATRLSEIREGLARLPVQGLTILIALMGATYGICMGCFAIFNRENPLYLQVVASMIKVPALYLLTLLVTMPSLYVFNALVGSRLRFLVVIRLLVASLAVSLTVLASFGPIVAFFSLTTTSYPFMKLLNVAVYALSGFLGLGFLLQTMHRLTLLDEQSDQPGGGASPDRSNSFGRGIGSTGQPAMPLGEMGPSEKEKATSLADREEFVAKATEDAVALAAKTEASAPAQAEAKIPGLTDFPGGVDQDANGPLPAGNKPPALPGQAKPMREPAGALDFIPSTTLSQNVRIVFSCWVVLFALVGAQMSWVLRPFIGAPNREFTWLRPRESNFFDAVLRAIFDLFK